jgi:hypothetical protein
LPKIAGERPLPLTAAALWTVSLWLLEHICFETTESLRPGAITDIVSVSACVALATSVVVFAMMRVHAPDGSVRASLGAGGIGPVRLALAAAAGVGLFPGPYSDAEALESMDKVLSSSTHVALVLGIFVVIPLAHEVFFRGILFGHLRAGASAAVTILATSLLFTVFPLEVRAMPTALLLALSLGWLRERTGSVFGPVAAHLAFWSVQGIPILRGADPAADVTYPATWIGGGAVLAVVALAAVGLLGPKDDPAMA